MWGINGKGNQGIESISVEFTTNLLKFLENNRLRIANKEKSTLTISEELENFINSMFKTAEESSLTESTSQLTLKKVEAMHEEYKKLDFSKVDSDLFSTFSLFEDNWKNKEEVIKNISSAIQEAFTMLWQELRTLWQSDTQTQKVARWTAEITTNTLNS